MPPHAKFTEEEIIRAAVDIVREAGLAGLTARALGLKLGSSARPIFTVFQNMEQVQAETVAAAQTLYNSYIHKALSQPDGEAPRFKRVGQAYIQFAIAEPKLFQLLFMTEQKNLPEFSHILPVIEENYEEILGSIQETYGLEREISGRLYEHLWVYTHGIAALCATKTCGFTEREISQMLTEVFRGLFMVLKGGTV